MPSNPWIPVAREIATEVGVPFPLFAALIDSESGWDPEARSPVGAYGLGQLMPGTARGLGVDPNDPRQNLTGAARYLKTQLEAFNDPRLALAAYNAGPGAVRKYGGIPPYAETQKYVETVLGRRSRYKPTAPGAPAVQPQQPTYPTLAQPEQPALDTRRQMAFATLEAFRTDSFDPIKHLQTLAQIAAQTRGLPSIRNGAKASTFAFPEVGRPADPSSAQVANARAEGAPGGVIGFARSALGTPYSWGGGTPSGPTRGFGRGANTVGYDCSSLVQAAWAKAGVSLPRVTYDQIKVGIGVSSKNMGAWKPGDLIFPHSGHVQLYIGNGKVIEAPYTGGQVRIADVRGTPLAVRRPKVPPKRKRR